MDPLGIASLSRTSDDKVCFSFAEYLDQDPAQDHSEEWSEILDELLQRSLVPVLMREATRSEFQTMSQSISSCL